MALDAANTHSALDMGTYGWQHPIWDQTYYPEDLPAEWRLSYYGNEFHVVIIPASYWLQDDAGEWSTAELEEWLEETDDSPRFICEWPLSLPLDNARIDTLIKLFLKLGDRVLGVVIPVSNQGSMTLKDLSQKLSSHFYVSLSAQSEMAQATVKEVYSELANDKLSICWDGQEQSSSVLQSGPLALTRLSESTYTPKQLRHILETCLNCTEESKFNVLIFEGEPPEIELIEQAETIASLL